MVGFKVQGFLPLYRDDTISAEIGRPGACGIYLIAGLFRKVYRVVAGNKNARKPGFQFEGHFLRG